MSLMSVLARLEAVAAGRAQPAASVLHRHLTERPMVFVPLTTAGEAGAPLGALIGTERENPRLLVVPQPRDRDLRFAFLAELAAVLLPHLESAEDEVETEERGGEEIELCADAPQLVVPNVPGVDFVRLLGRSMRFRRTAEQDPDTPHPAPPHVPLLGRWLTHYGERARVPGASLLLPMTGLLARHWATGQSHLEDQHLGALLAWIDPPADGDGAQAALRAETERDAEGLLRCPPAGPATDPAFDNGRLAPAIAAFDAARAAQHRATGAQHTAAQHTAAQHTAEAHRAEQRIRELLAAQLQPTWEAVWRGLDLLRTLPEGASVADRWRRDRFSYTHHRDRVRSGEPPQPKRDDAVAAAAKLASREQAQARLDAQEALDDPLAMAARRLAGEAFAGEVVAVEMAYSEAKRPRPRPLVTIRSEDEPHLAALGRVHRATAEGTVQTAEFTGHPEPAARGGAEPAGRPEHAGAPGLITVRLTSGMGRGKEPAPGTVPQVGDELCWTLFEHAPRGGPGLPEAEDTPWTHGGPPGSPQTPDTPDGETTEDFL